MTILHEIKKDLIENCFLYDNCELCFTYRYHIIILSFNQNLLVIAKKWQPQRFISQMLVII